MEKLGQGLMMSQFQKSFKAALEANIEKFSDFPLLSGPPEFKCRTHLVKTKSSKDVREDLFQLFDTHADSFSKLLALRR